LHRIALVTVLVRVEAKVRSAPRNDLRC
jgi:hypothetical protein